MKARIIGRYLTPAEQVRLMAQPSKADAIAVLIDCGIGDRAAHSLKTWCNLHHGSVLQSDLQQLRAARVSILIRELPLEGE